MAKQERFETKGGRKRHRAVDQRRKSTIHAKPSDLRRLTTKGATNTADCTVSQVFRRRVHYGDGSGNTYPATENVQTVVERGLDNMAYNFVRRVLRFRPVLPKQQKTYRNASDRCHNGEVTSKLGRSTSAVSRINAWDGQECHVGVQ